MNNLERFFFYNQKAKKEFKVISRWNSGLTLSQNVSHLKIHYSTGKKICEKYHLKYAPLWIKKAVSLRQRGISLRDISKVINISHEQIRSKCSNLNLLAS